MNMSNKARNIKGTLLLGNDRPSIIMAASILQNGGLVAFPTETVYGLGASALDDRALEKVFIAKGRPADNPLIVHIASVRELETVAINIPNQAYILAESFWPGPLSLVLERAPGVSPMVSAGLKTVAVRMPDRPEALSLIREAGLPVAAPSANISGSPSPTTYRHVIDDLAGKIDAVIMSAPCAIGVESTVLDLTGSSPVILRPGGLSKEKLELALGLQVALSVKSHASPAPSSPGMKYRHYKPCAPLLLVTGSPSGRKKLLRELAAYYGKKGKKVAFLNFDLNKYSDQAGDVDAIAAKLYSSLRCFDSRGYDLILAEETDLTGLGLAVMNRLTRAATRVVKVLD